MVAVVFGHTCHAYAFSAMCVHFGMRSAYLHLGVRDGWSKGRNRKKLSGGQKWIRAPEMHRRGRKRRKPSKFPNTPLIIMTSWKGPGKLQFQKQGCKFRNKFMQNCIACLRSVVRSANVTYFHNFTRRLSNFSSESSLNIQFASWSVMLSGVFPQFWYILLDGHQTGCCFSLYL